MDQVYMIYDLYKTGLDPTANTMLVRVHRLWT